MYGIVQSCSGQSTAQYEFLIDGSFVGEYTYTDMKCPGVFLYNQLLFAQDGISSGTHTFTFQNGQSGVTTEGSLALFDYIIYTKYVFFLQVTPPV